MTSISSATGSLGSTGSYYTQLLAAKAAAGDNNSVDQSGTDTSLSAAETQALTSLAGTGTSSDGSALSALLGSTSGSGNTLASLLGSSFTDTNSLLSQINALATGSSAANGSSTAGGSATDGSSTTSATDGASQQQKIAGLLANMFQTDQSDFLSMLL